MLIICDHVVDNAMVHEKWLLSGAVMVDVSGELARVTGVPTVTVTKTGLDALKAAYIPG